MGLLILVVLGLGLVGCAVLGLAAAVRALGQLRELEEAVARQRDDLEEVRRQLRSLRLKGTTPASTSEPVPATPPTRPAPLVGPPVATAPEPRRVPPTESEWAEKGSGLTAEGSGPHLAEGVEPTRAGSGPKASWFEGFDWEDLVGVQLFSWIAAIALTLASVFFLRYSIQQGWLQPPVQMTIGLLVGIVLLAVCEMSVAGNYRVTANAMDASGIAILFATFFAAYARWHLVGIVPAFIGLALVTAIAVVLSTRRDSLFIAGLGLVGGFLTPWLLSTGQDNPLGLFGYLFVLNAGLAWVAYYKRWPWLTSASVALTTLYQWGWVITFMRPDRIPLGGSIFLVFPALNAAFLVLNREPAHGTDARVFSRTTDVSAVLPVLFAMYLAATPGYTDHVTFVFGFLLCLCAGLFALAVARRQELLHVVGGASAFFVVTTYLDTSYLPSAWPGIVAWIAIFVVFYLAGEWMAAAAGRPLGAIGGWGTFAAPALLFGFALLAGLEPATRAPWLLFGTVFMLGSAAALTEFTFGRHGLRMATAGTVALVLFAWLERYRRPEMAIVLAAAWAVIVLAWTYARRVARSAGPLEPDASCFAAAVTAELVTVFAGLVSTASVAVLTAGHVAFLSAALWMATARGWFRAVPPLVVPAALAILFWFANYPPPVPWQPELLLAAGSYAVFLVYPLVVERRAATVDEPWLAAVIASGVFFLAARHSLLAGGFEPVIGLLPMVQAALMAVLLWRLLQLEPAVPRRLGRLALVAGALLAFVTVAVPLQLEKQWITIGWALEGAALAWLYRRIPHRGLLVACLVLLAAAFGRLTMNPELLTYHERTLPILNWYLYTYLLSAFAMFAAGRFLETTDDVPVRDMDGAPRGSTLARAGAVALLFALVNIEIADFYSVDATLSFHFSATLAQDLTYTLAWAVFGVALLVAGIIVRSHAARIGALALLVITVLKGFLHDLARLGGLYRVFSFVGLAVCLALVALVLQKFVLQLREEERAAR